MNVTTIGIDLAKDTLPRIDPSQFDVRCTCSQNQFSLRLCSRTPPPPPNRARTVLGQLRKFEALRLFLLPNGRAGGPVVPPLPAQGRAGVFKHVKCLKMKQSKNHAFCFAC